MPESSETASSAVTRSAPSAEVSPVSGSIRPRKPAPICRTTHHTMRQTTRHTKCRVRSAGAESARKRTRRPPEAGNRAHIPRAIASREAMLWQGCSLSPSELERKRRAPFGAICVARVSPLPRSEWTPCRQSAALRGKAVGTSAAHIRRAAVRGLGTFTWGFLRHSPASVLARGKNRRDARRVSVGEAVLWPWWKPWNVRIMAARVGGRGKSV